MRLLDITIKNWAKHNPGGRATKHYYFKMSNDFFSDPDFYRASLEARMLWIFILCAASKKMSGEIKLNTQQAADSLNVRLEVIDYALNELNTISCLTVHQLNEIHLQDFSSKDGCTEKRIIREENNKIREEKSDIASIETETEAKKILPSVTPQENLKGDFCQTVITMLNSLCDSRYPVTKEYCALINSRKADGYSLEDFKSVITFRQSTWANDPKMRQWLRPETLFGTKFYSYLEQSKNPIKGKLEASQNGNPYLAELQRRKSREQA